MPPRYAYWTILIDGKATAFRAKDREELLPTLNQLRRKNGDVALRYFSRGKLWDSPEQADWANRNARDLGERRDRNWRPGGSHRDPRSRFDKKPQGHSDARARGEEKEDRKPRREFDRDSRDAHSPKPFKGDRRDGGWTPKPAVDRQRAWSGKPRDRRDQNPTRGGSNDGRPLTNEKSAGRPWSAKPERRGPWKPKDAAHGSPAARDSRSHPPKPRDDRRDNRGGSREGQRSPQRPWQSERQGDDRSRGGAGGSSRDARPQGHHKSFTRPDSSRPWIPNDNRSAQKERRWDERPPRKPWVPKADRQDRREGWKSAKPHGQKPAGGGQHRKPGSPRDDRRGPRADQQRRTGSRDDARGSRQPRNETRRDDWRKRPDFPNTPEGPDERREAAPKPPRESRPDRPPSSEQIVTKPEPPERG
jgi:hypothetical protein